MARPLTITSVSLQTRLLYGPCVTNNMGKVYPAAIKCSDSKWSDKANPLMNPWLISRSILNNVGVCPSYSRNCNTYSEMDEEHYWRPTNPTMVCESLAAPRTLPIYGISSKRFKTPNTESRGAEVASNHVTTWAFPTLSVCWLTSPTSRSAPNWGPLS